MKQKIAFFEVEGWEKEYLKKRLKDQDLTFFKEELSLEHVKKIKNIHTLSVFYLLKN